MNVAAILFLRIEAVFAGAIFVETFGFAFPARAHVLKNRRVAGLPIVTADVVDLETGLMVFETFADKIEERPEQAARIFFKTPDHHRERGVTAFGFIKRVVLIARAVTHAVAVDEFEILNEKMPPRV